MTTTMTVGTINQGLTVAIDNNPFNNTTLWSWISFCDVQAATQKTYDKAIQSFLAYLKDNAIERPTREDVIAYREFLINGGYKVSTVRLYMTIAKKFFRWLASQCLYPNVADGVKLPKLPTDEHAHDALTLDEAKATLSTFKGKSEKDLRDKAIMAIMLNCGLRSVEVVRLDLGDIEKRRGVWVVNVRGKGQTGKVSVQISEPLKKIIDEYLAVRPKGKKNTALFISTARRNRGQRLQTQVISRLAKRTFKSIGIESDRVTCHSCRSTACTLMLEAGISIREVQKTLRHRRVETTEIYARDLNAFNNKGVATLGKLLFAAA